MPDTIDYRPHKGVRQAAIEGRRQGFMAYRRHRDCTSELNRILSQPYWRNIDQRQKDVFRFAFGVMFWELGQRDRKGQRS